MPPRRHNQAPPPQDSTVMEQRLDTLSQQIADLQEQFALVLPALTRRAPRPPIGEHARGHPHRHDQFDYVSGDSSDDDTVMDNPFATLDSQRANRDESARRWESGLKLDIPEFHGDLDADGFLDWLAAIDEILSYKEVPQNRRVPLVCTRLRNRAAAWWQQLKATRARQGKSRITTWEKFLKHLRAEFLPFNYSRVLYQKLQTLRQGNRSIDEYTTEFYQLLARVDISETPDQLVSRYIGGLHVSFQDVLNLFSPTTVSEAHQRALLLERQLSRKPLGPFAAPIPPTDRSTTPRSPASHGTNSSSASKQPQIVAPEGSSRPGPCFNCGEFGHQKASCPRRGRGLFLGDSSDQDHGLPIYDEEPLPPTDTVQLVGDTGPALVLRRTCLSPRHEDSEIHRHKLFESTCTINGKVCRFIIDSGACENVIAQDVVEKLSLPTEVHPHPYSLAWLQSGTNILVHRRSLVQFSVGTNYVDSTWCDIVPMDACHLLLGRPWQYDRGVLHDGRHNTYTFIHSGIKFVLVPSVPMPSSLPHESNVLLNRADFVPEMHQVSSVFLLVTHDQDLEVLNEQYKADADSKWRDVPFDVGDCDGNVFTRKTISANEAHMLACKIDPYESFEKIHPNACQRSLPSHTRTSTVFPATHTFPFLGDTSYGDEVADDSWANRFNGGENDGDEVVASFLTKARTH